MIPHNKKVVNTFTVCQPVNEQFVELVFCMLSGFTNGQAGKNFSYSIVGKIKGLHVVEGTATIEAGYQSGSVLTDIVSVVDGQFLYCNKSNETVTLNLKVRLKGVLSWQGDIDMTFQAKMHYSPQKFTVTSIHSSYVSIAKATFKPQLMQQVN